MRHSAVLLGFLSFALLACGQLAEESSGTPTSTAASGPAASATTGASSPSVAAASGTANAAASAGTTATAREPAPAVCAGAATTPIDYATASEAAVAIRGLWIRCDASELALLCPMSDQVVVLGSLDAPQDTTSRGVACGNLTSHGSGFIPDPAASFTYDVVNRGSGGFALHVWNAGSDRTFELVAYGATSPAMEEDALALSGAGTSEAIRRTAFTTY